MNYIIDILIIVNYVFNIVYIVLYFIFNMIIFPWRAVKTSLTKQGSEYIFVIALPNVVYVP